MRTAFKIQSFVMKLPRPRIAAGARRRHFPLSKEEMRWHLAYFDVAAMSCVAARPALAPTWVDTSVRPLSACAAKPGLEKPRVAQFWLRPWISNSWAAMQNWSGPETKAAPPALAPEAKPLSLSAASVIGGRRRRRRSATSRG